MLENRQININQDQNAENYLKVKDSVIFQRITNDDLAYH